MVVMILPSCLIHRFCRHIRNPVGPAINFSQAVGILAPSHPPEYLLNIVLPFGVSVTYTEELLRIKVWVTPTWCHSNNPQLPEGLGPGW